MQPRPPMRVLFKLRRAVDADLRPAFAIFRRSVINYAFERGIVPSPEVPEEAVEDAWTLRGPWIEHLWRTSAENWIAVDEDDRPIGWAMSVERGGGLELTHFFVEPGTQSRGVGRALLSKALPAAHGGHRSIIATQDPRAMGLYLRSGVRFITTIADFEAAPRAASVEADLVLERLEPNDASARRIADVEQHLIGHRREVDTRFILGQRPAWLALRAGEAVGFAFGHADELTGPIGALDPGDIPALLAHVENHAAETGATNIYFSTPLENHAAVTHLLGRGYTMDAFLVSLLADDRWIKADRWIHTGWSYIL